MYCDLFPIGSWTLHPNVTDVCIKCKYLIIFKALILIHSALCFIQIQAYLALDVESKFGGYEALNTLKSRLHENLIICLTIVK
jgi:hypothetical protein